ncbi:hypothetical protein [Pseudoflavonifractor capillosus]|uniref:hypothetical protein n=1 Tax=Pseudoflavonifractor capillosus TaxID=106588 RepID=UPI001FB0170D|nr:hypothetical protein [Pseudoflavonifractor capillosus]
MAPNLPIADLKPAYRENAIRGFLRQQEMFSPERRADYLSYIKTHCKNLSPLALEEPELLRMMLEGKMLTPKAAEQLAVQAAQEGWPEAAAQLLNYQNKIFPMEKRLETEKRRLQRQTRQMERELNLLESGGEPQPKQPKLWRYEKDEKGNLTLLGYKGGRPTWRSPPPSMEFRWLPSGTTPSVLTGSPCLRPSAKPGGKFAPSASRRAF